MTQAEHPPLPSVSVKAIVAKRNELVSKLAHFIGQQLIADKYHEFVDRLHYELPKGILRTVVHDSVKSLLKKELTKDLLVATCWRLAANIEQLRSVKPVPPWTRQRVFEWIPVQICGVETHRKGKNLTNLFTFQSLGGSLVPKTLAQSWSLNKTNYMARYRNEKNLGFGFGRSHVNKRGEQKGRGLFLDVRQFYGLRCFLLLDPNRSQTDPFAVEVGHTHATMEYNKQLIAARDRQQNPCIKGISDSLECFLCPYGVDRCVLATHAVTYKRQTCPRCSQTGFIDPTEFDYPGTCVNCVFELRKL